MFQLWYEEEHKYIRCEDSNNLIASRAICMDHLASYIIKITNNQRGWDLTR
jgi:hypothetical protein